MVSMDALIWSSIQPVIRCFLTVFAGFALTKAEYFPTEAARGGAQFVMKFAAPCLLFSKIVPAFSTQNISALVSLTVVVLLYGMIGTLMAWVIRCFFWVPHRFRYGILAAGCWSNYGDIPVAIAVATTASVPLNTVKEQNLAVVYSTMFSFFIYITLVPLGGFLIVRKDFEGPDVPSEELREQMYLRRRKMVKNAALLFRRLGRLLRLSRHTDAGEIYDVEVGGNLEGKDDVSSIDQGEKINSKTHTLALITTISATTTVCEGSIFLAPTPTLITDLPELPMNHHIGPSDRHHRHLSRLWHILKVLYDPWSVVIVLAIAIALVDPLKALFLPPSSQFQPRFRPVAPDRRPPLAFILDTTTFIGAASVPVGLTCLGSAIATSLNLRSGGPFPKGAIASLALAKMIVIPLLGIWITRLFVHVGFIQRDDKALQLVCIVLSGLPAATNLVNHTLVYSPTGSAEHFSAFAIPQYILMPFTMTGLVTYALNHLS